MAENILVCGTRRKGYGAEVFKALDEWVKHKGLPDSIIEGCCPDSADVYAEEWALKHGVRLQHHPSTTGNYLSRNIEMVKKASMIIAWWDGYSYGTCHTIAHAVLAQLPVIIVSIRRR